jgi:hypothetical protein
MPISCDTRIGKVLRNGRKGLSSPLFILLRAAVNSHLTELRPEATPLPYIVNHACLKTHTTRHFDALTVDPAIVFG